MAMFTSRAATLSLLIAGLMMALSGVASAKVREGDRAADFVQVTDAKGKRISLKRYKDRVVVMTFGASWCPPCKKELPALEKLAKKYKAKGAKVVFIAVNIDNDEAKGKKFIAQARLKHVMAVFDAKKSTVDSYDPPKMPSTFIISRGIVKHVHGGFRNGDEKSIAKHIDKELQKL